MRRALAAAALRSRPDQRYRGEQPSVTSFTQASDENGLSRILVGFHFRKAVKEGIVHGIKIGDWAVDRFLQPVH